MRVIQSQNESDIMPWSRIKAVHAQSKVICFHHAAIRHDGDSCPEYRQDIANFHTVFIWPKQIYLKGLIFIVFVHKGHLGSHLQVNKIS